MTEDKNMNPEDLQAEDVVTEENPVETLEEEAHVVESSEGRTEEKDENTVDMKELFRKKKEMLETIKKLENENRALKDRLARISAEYENYRKRTQKEKEEIYADSIVEVVKELLPVLDNLEMSLKVEAQDVEALKKGISMTLTQFQDSLQKLKVSVISTDTPFDPNFHEAVMHVEDPNYSEKEIVEVFLKGYKREDKIIRYSVVKVAN